MKSRILSIILALGLVIAVVSAGAWAYFDDVETSTDNTFTSGSFDMILHGGTQDGDSVIGTWVSPSNWSPGETLYAELNFTNNGSIDAMHIYFQFTDFTCDDKGDGSNFADVIIVKTLKERFNGVETGNLAGYIDSQVGNNDGVLTLQEFAGWAVNWYGYYTFDDVSGDGILLAAGNHWDYQLILEFEFDPNAGNEYQGDTCQFTLVARATQNSPTDGMIPLHPSA